MKVFVDENIPKLTVLALVELGCDVKDIRGTKKQGSEDDDLWSIVQAEKRLFITTDKGFCRKRNEHHYGILVVRLHQPNLKRIHERVIQAFKHWHHKEWPGRLVVMRDKTQSVWRHKQKN